MRKNIRMNVVLCYTPIVGKSDEVKDQFYNQLQDTLNKLRDQDINMSSFSANIGSDKTR